MLPYLRRPHLGDIPPNWVFVGIAFAVWSFVLITAHSLDLHALFNEFSFRMGKFPFASRPLAHVDVVAGLALGMLVALFFPFRFLLVAIPAGLLASVVMAMVVRTGTGLRLSGVDLAGAYILGAATIYYYRHKIKTEVVTSITATVRGALPPPVIQQIALVPQSFNGADREISTSVLVVGIVGFSTIAEKFSADAFFPSLRAIYRNISTIVHNFGGVLDRSFRGDSFMIYFGDNMLFGSAVNNHADLALQCAVEIQKSNIPLILEADKLSRPIFALKCGIHSARGYLGNLGEGGIVNMSMVGRVVENANQCLTACEAHCVMFTKTTHDLLVNIDRASPLFISRYMHMRNEQEMIKVVEFDPLHDLPDFRRQATQALRKCAELERKGRRFDVKRQDYYQLTVNAGPATLVNVSNGGLGVRLEKGFALGTTVTVVIQTTDEVLNRRLQYRNLNKVTGEVRWSRQIGSAYLTGILLKEIKTDNAEFLLQAILDADRATA